MFNNSVENQFVPFAIFIFRMKSERADKEG